ncbi:MAG: ribosome assembly cofactor RimP, partial [Muribaculaceae bacterium]|nr:ribosome assembly cofactor RimP [Muribaculaceae bacterium]
MIDKMLLEQVLTKGMEGTDLFIVDVTIGKDNNIVVEIDSDTSVDIDECVRLTRLVESHFDRDKEDYDLEIGSAGLTSPLKVERQYHKNIGNEVEVLTADGRKLKGVLKAVDSEGFVLTTEQKV